MEISFEAWEGVQRHGQDIADRLAQGFTGLLQAPPQFPWPPASGHKRGMPFDIDLPVVPFGAGRNSKDFFPTAAVASVIDIGGRLGQAGVEIGTSVGGAVQHAVRQLPVPFRSAQIGRRKLPSPAVGEGVALDRAVDRCPLEAAAAAAAAATGSAAASSVSGVAGGDDLDEDDEGYGCEIGTLGNFKKAKNGVHSLCPAIWSKQRRWLMMSMMCLNPIACSFMDLQFPNGQVTYVAGEGITASGFVPLFGGLLQAHGKFPGETRMSYSCKNKRGTRFTPMFQWPDKSLSLGVTQALAWKRSGLMVRPSVQVSLCPTFGGSDPGVRAEVIHSLKEELNVMCGLSCTRHPSAFTAVSIGRSKWNGQVGSSGVVVTLETPLNNIGRPSLSVQLNGGFEI